MERRMSVTSNTAHSSEKPAEAGARAPLKRSNDRIEKPYQFSRIEREDWRGEGVVGDNHTD